MPIPGEANSAPRLEERPGRGWWFRRWAGRRVMAGIADRHIDPADLIRALELPVTMVEVEQVHGSSVAIVEHCASATTVVAGADALLTRVPGVALLVRTADCLPVFFADPPRGVVGIAHAGWRGLAASLLARVVSAFRHTYHSQASELRVALGPAIRVCCYEVGAEFRERFGPCVRERGGRWMCDLVGVARTQLEQCGVRSDRVLDSQRCTSCEPQHWFSVRREGDGAGRLTSLIVLQP